MTFIAHINLFARQSAQKMCFLIHVSQSVSYLCEECTTYFSFSAKIINFLGGRKKEIHNFSLPKMIKRVFPAALRRDVDDDEERKFAKKKDINFF